MAQELNIITHTYDLLQWTLGHAGKFPRNHRRGLGARLEVKMYDLLDALVEAKYSSDKAELLRTAALLVEQVRLLFRLAKDLRILSLRSHHFAVSRLQETGRLA